MRKEGVTLVILLGLFLLSAQTVSATVTTHFNPDPVVAVVGDTFEIEILADVDDEPFNAFAIGFEVDNTLLQHTYDAIGPGWNYVGQLVGEAPDINDPYHDQNDILLWTVGFTCLGEGTSTIELVGQGFVLAVDSGGSIAFYPQEWINDDYGIVTQVLPAPEPATMLLLATGLLGLADFRRRFRR